MRLSFELKNPLTVEIRVEFFMGFSLYRWRRNEKCPGRWVPYTPSSHPYVYTAVRLSVCFVLEGREKKVAAVKSFLMGFFAFLPIECVLAGDFSKRWENVGGNQGGKKKNRLHIDTHMLYKCHEEEKFCTVADKMVGHGLWHMDGWGEPFLAIHIFPALIPD